MRAGWLLLRLLVLSDNNFNFVPPMVLCVFEVWDVYFMNAFSSEFVCPNGPFSYSCSIARLVFFVFGRSYDALLSAFVPLFSVFLSFDGFTSSFFLFALYVYL